MKLDPVIRDQVLATVPRTWSRMAGSSFMLSGPLSILLLIAQAANQVGDMLRHALIDDVVV